MANSKHMRNPETKNEPRRQADSKRTAIVTLIAVVLAAVGCGFWIKSSLTPEPAAQEQTLQGSTAVTERGSASAENNGQAQANAASSSAATDTSADEDAAAGRLAADPAATTSTQTDWATLQYPARWDDVCKVDEDSDSVRYVATVHPGEETLLFTVSTKPLDGGAKLGSLNGQDLYLKTEEPEPGSDWTSYEAAELSAMLEDVNVLIDSLQQTPGFEPAR